MPKEYCILIAGDLLPCPKNKEKFIKGDVEYLFGDKILQMFTYADYSIFNLEGPLTKEKSKIEKNGPRLRALPESINAIKALGVSAVSLANNHSMDFGHQGYLDTVNILYRANIEYIGAGENQTSIKKYSKVTLGDKNVCIYCVSETFFNKPSETEAGVNIYDEYIVCNEIKELSKTSDYIIVLYHGGTEYFQYPTPIVKKRCHRMADSGANCIITQHTHCIGCEEYYNGAYILYGQGNFHFARQKTHTDLTKEGLLLELTIKEDSVDVKKHYISIINEVIRYSEIQDFSAFDDRSQKSLNDNLINNMYQEFIVDEIMFNYLQSFKGFFPLRKFFQKLLPKKYHNYVINSFSRQQIFQIIDTLSCDRRNEDMNQVMKYLLNKTKK